MSRIAPAALLDRARRAREALSSCRLCEHHCGVDRTRGPAGRCLSDATSRVFYEGIEWAGEAELVPTYVASLAGCNLTCAFCLTGRESQDGSAGGVLDPDAVAARIDTARRSLASVTILGGEPTVHLDGALDLAARVPKDLLLVWKTNAFASREALDLLEGVPDVVLADLKFGNDRCARRLAGIDGYVSAVSENLERWAGSRTRLIVRHLLVPGHLDCCLVPVVERLARDLPGVPASLMTGYLPAFRVREHPGLSRLNRPEEVARAKAVLRVSGVPFAPWKVAASPSRSAEPLRGGDDLWIDRDGNVCVDSASADLLAVLRRIGLELATLFPEGAP